MNCDDLFIARGMRVSDLVPWVEIAVLCGTIVEW